VVKSCIEIQTHYVLSNWLLSMDPRRNHVVSGWRQKRHLGVKRLILVERGHVNAIQMAGMCTPISREGTKTRSHFRGGGKKKGGKKDKEEAKQ